MATCILCGKKGIFLRINNHGRCKACQEKYDLAKQEEQRIATEMRIAFEKEQLESQEHDFKYTDLFFFIYTKITNFWTACFFGLLYIINTTGRIKQYFEFSHQYEPDVLRSTTLKTTPRSKTYEDSGKRIFFESEEEFMSLATVIIEIYHKQKAYVDENIAHERMAHNANDTGFIRLVATISPHYEKSVNRYLENPELIKL